MIVWNEHVVETHGDQLLYSKPNAFCKFCPLTAETCNPIGRWRSKNGNTQHAICCPGNIENMYYLLNLKLINNYLRKFCRFNEAYTNWECVRNNIYLTENVILFAMMNRVWLYFYLLIIFCSEQLIVVNVVAHCGMQHSASELQDSTSVFTLPTLHASAIHIPERAVHNITSILEFFCIVIKYRIEFCKSVDGILNFNCALLSLLFFCPSLSYWIFIIKIKD